MIRFFLLLPLTIIEIILFSGLTIIAIWSDKTGDNYYKVSKIWARFTSVSYTHLRAHETVLDLVCRLLLEKKTQYQ